MYKTKKIKINGWEVYDLPRKYSLEDYREVRQEISKKVGSVPGVISILEWGTVHHPGIADMDFFVVFDKEAKSMNIPNSINLSEKALYLMMHRFLVMSEEVCSNFFYFVPWVAHKYPKGIPSIFSKKRISFKPLVLSRKEEEFLNLTCLYERNEQVFSLIKYLANKSLPIRHLFEVLKIADRCIIQINELCSIQIKTDFRERFRKLEDSWFETDLNDGVLELAKLLREGLRVAFHITFAIGKYLKDKMDYLDIDKTKIQLTRGRYQTILDKKADNLYFNSSNYSRVFTDLSLSPDEAFEQSLKLYKEYKLPLRSKMVVSAPIIQPLQCSFYLTAIAQGEGLCSERFRKDFFYSGKRIPILNSQALTERINLLNRTVKIYSHKYGENTLGKGYIYGANFPGYYYEHEKWKRKILLWYLKRTYFLRINKLI